MKKILFLFLFIYGTLYIETCMCQWIPSNNGIPSGQYVISLAVTGNVLFAGTSNSVYKSTNEGASWTELVTNTGGIKSIAINGTYYYASTSDGYWKSSNSGVNWEKTMFYGAPPVWSVSASNGNVYCTIGGDRVWKTTNNGMLWEPSSPGGDVRYVSANEPYVFAGFYNYSFGGNGGVYRSVNSGANWIRTLADINIYCLAQNDSLVYAGAVDDTSRTGGVYVSTNFGLNWARSSLDSVPVKTLFAGGNNIFAGVDNTYYPGFTEYAGFWASTNRGQTWIKRNDGFTVDVSNLPVSAIAVLNNNVYTAISGGGIWKRPLAQVIGVQNISSGVPNKFTLYQNYPNPFNPTTIIKFDIPSNAKGKTSDIKLVVFDILGKEVTILVSENLKAGKYEVTFDGSYFPSGIYFYQLKTDNFTETKKLILLK